MKSKHCDSKIIIKLEKGEEIIKSIQDFCETNNIYSGTINGIGAATKVVLGYFNLKTNKYIEKTFSDDYEIISLSGTIAIFEEKPILHIHISIADNNFNIHGGHLISATVSVTFEGILNPFPDKLERTIDENFGLKLLNV
jgi:hypothetical protein